MCVGVDTGMGVLRTLLVQVVHAGAAAREKVRGVEGGLQAHPRLRWPLALGGPGEGVFSSDVLFTVCCHALGHGKKKGKPEDTAKGKHSFLPWAHWML